MSIRTALRISRALGVTLATGIFLVGPIIFPHSILNL